MTLTSSLALFGSMVVLGLMPGPGVMAVVARTLAGGHRHGVSAAAGIVAGDFVFITLALLGLAALLELMGGFYALIRYLGAAYLVWLGVSLAFSKNGGVHRIRPVRETGHLASFTAALLITLGNPKAVLFYFSFLPAFVDLSDIAVRDAAVVYALAAVAVGGVMCGYAYAVHKASSAFRLSRRGPLLRYGSGALLVGSGILVAARG